MTKQSGIVRSPDFAGGGITDEEKEKMAAHSALWIKRTYRTEPADPAAIEEAIKGLYRVANLDEPRVIVVPSPLVMAMAGGIASVWWYLFENKLLGKKRKAATAAATKAVTAATTAAAADAMTRAATYAATDDATYHATEAATRNATYHATYAATYAAIKVATDWAGYMGERG